MNNISRIPEETGYINLIINSGHTFDSNGLECVIKPDGASVFVRTRATEDDFDNGFIVRQGEEFTFCGKIFVCAKEACRVYYMKYRTL